MKIKELNWIVANKNQLDNEDMEYLNENKIFEQYEKGELNFNGVKMLEVIGKIFAIYEKHNK